MAIIAYTGLMGDGKSYGVVENVILKNLRLGRTVWSNIPMVAEQLDAEIPGHKFHQVGAYDERWQTGEALSEIPKGAITVLDELWTVLPSGMKANKVPAAWKHFIAEHRHEVGEDGFTSEIVFVTQDLADIAAFARGKVQRTFMVRKLWAVGADNRFIVDIYRGAVTGQRGPESLKMGSSLGTYSPEVYKFYVSHTKGGGKIGHEAVADKRGVIWRHPMVMYGVPVAVVAVVACVVMGYRFLRGITDAQASTVAPVASQRVVAPQRKRVAEVTVRPQERRSTVPVRESGLKFSTRWRVAGIVQRENGSGTVVLVDEQRSLRYLQLQDCERTGPRFDDLACVVEGQRATIFSGVNAGWLPAIVQPSG